MTCMCFVEEPPRQVGYEQAPRHGQKGLAPLGAPISLIWKMHLLSWIECIREPGARPARIFRGTHLTHPMYSELSGQSMDVFTIAHDGTRPALLLIRIDSAHIYSEYRIFVVRLLNSHESL